ncbi:MAG TPA: hypothetical protein VII94_03565 [Candidatus Saccharimonadales bacterium]
MSAPKTISELLASLSDDIDNIKVIQCHEYGVGSLSEDLARNENEPFIIEGGKSRKQLAKWLDELYRSRVALLRIQNAIQEK